MRKIFILSFLLSTFLSATVNGQVDVKYQKPAKSILDLADAAMTPRVKINSEGTYVVILERNRYKTLQELSETELRLGGLRINPKTNIGSRTYYYIGISVQEVGEKELVKIGGLPENCRLANFSWSPNQKYMAFTNTTLKGVELWMLDIKNARIKKLSSDNLNANMGSPYSWFKNSTELLVKFLPKDKKALINKKTAIPDGPIISENDGQKAQNRTYQDLLKDKNDEFNFEQLTRSELYQIHITGKKKLWKEAAIYDDIDFSPDGNYLMISTIKKPFSYLVTYYRFPFSTIIYDKSGKEIKEIMDIPLDETRPKGFMATREGKRNMSWRADKPATIYWAEALDNGDPAKEVDFRDEVFQLEAPFTSKPTSLVKTKYRSYRITWAKDDYALAHSYWWNTRTERTVSFNPLSNQQPILIKERNYQDKYNDPGSFVTEKNKYGRRVLVIDKNNVYLEGDGYSKDGIRPFIDKMNLKTKKKTRLWQAENKTELEKISFVINIKEGKILTYIQAPTVYPNYYIRNIKTKKAAQQITFIENPFKSMAGVHKEVIKYKRKDGLELSATLYLPANYDMNKKEKLPMLMWAYPQEFKDKKSAGQVTSSPLEFTYPYYGSFVYWVTKGYVVLDDAAFPIVGENDTEPNDSFIEQLVANAEAAIDAVDKLGYVDRNRVAVGGHSYGAFMTANLLTHCDLFAAGIARSGAYNRTLTPFGFQAEERSYWDAHNVYYEMSPFMHADKMKTPLLLIHGEADNNSGTYPMQSERYFNALKGLGATVRLVILPKESHGYVARESILHLLWEQDQWLEKYVKNKK